MDTNVPAPVWEMLERFIEGQSMEFADNYRAYRVRDLFNKNAYDEAFQNGCCGFADWKVTIPALGEEWVIGCNYGH